MVSRVFLVLLEKEDFGKCEVCLEKADSLKLEPFNLFSK